jgi:hypothetical protein
VLKLGSIGPPKQYLGAPVGEFRLPDKPEKVIWSLSSEKYAKEAIRDLQLWLKERDFAPLKSTTTMLPTGYLPALDAMEYCNSELNQYYQQQILVLRWLVELGRINICTEVSMLAAFAAAP